MADPVAANTAIAPATVKTRMIDCIFIPTVLRWPLRLQSHATIGAKGTGYGPTLSVSESPNAALDPNERFVGVRPVVQRKKPPVSPSFSCNGVICRSAHAGRLDLAGGRMSTVRFVGWRAAGNLRRIMATIQTSHSRCGGCCRHIHVKEIWSLRI